MLQIMERMCDASFLCGGCQVPQVIHTVEYAFLGTRGPATVSVNGDSR